MAIHDLEQRHDDGRSARERILDAAIALFAEHGVAGTSLKVIAEQADVSQALIVHHFASKQGLRDACDAHIIGVIRDQMRQARDEGADLDVLAAFRRRHQAQAHALPYLARALSEGGPQVDALSTNWPTRPCRAWSRPRPTAPTWALRIPASGRWCC